MAKTAKPKKAPTANPRSRASKRATSPSIDTDKSLKDGPRASDATPVLSAKPYGGITKAKKKQKPLSRGQRRRQERGLERAVIVQDQLVKKVGDAQQRQKKIRERKGLWEDTNGHNQFDKLANILTDDVDENDGGAWVDEDMGEAESVKSDVKIVDGVELPASAAVTKLLVVDRTASANNTDTENDIDNIT